ncbi:putative serine protease PepD [Kitasatospora sp. MAP12-15]|uniref:S1C family serine protease n=1 Tax=unclassified Kitasatospora TaxID=2633591 RepID=UPI00247428F6|nr:trypsin-like peptidase domain-containing protein [Kitasatospora sp. MAP12-44]MDH6111101.1 putative serine protease PepD [Kitasatospora sp. MAP12-44]
MHPTKDHNRPIPAGPRPTGPKALPALSGAAVLAAVLAVGGCSSSAPSTSSTAASSSSSPSPSGAPAPTTSDQLQNEYQQVIANVLPSVVQITTAAGLGSGIVYDDKGDIVTNAHVVGTATSFDVTLANSTTTLPATLVGSYPDDDLAVIKLSSPPNGLRPATFGNSAKVEVGQITLAMGSPLGLSSSVTEGIVSAIARTVSEPSGGGSPGATIGNMVQTSAAINPGNSGGALVNLSSQVIGINTLAAVDQEANGGAAPGIGFAIPSATITNIADQLIKTGKVTNSGRAALGITARTYYGSDFTPAGAVVVGVTAGGPAASAGLQAGDVITQIGTTPVTSLSSLTTALASLSPDSKVTVTYLRGGQTKTADVTLGTLSATS